MEGETPHLTLKADLCGYFSALSDVLPRLESIEKEAVNVIDKLHDHLEQLDICQRLEAQ